MARARNIKPGFFLNEELVELDFSVRLLFIGLWTIADRAGRLEDKPKRIKMALFPADNLDVEAALCALEKSGFIIRYESGDNQYIQILAFEKHQNPHKDEKASTIPAPCLHHAGTVQDQQEHGGNRADSLLLIPDSLFSNTDVLLDAKQPLVDPCPHQAIINIYHEVLPMGLQVKVWNGTRAAHLKARWREDQKRQTLDYWRRLFGYIAESTFLTGRVHDANRHPFEISLDWIVAPNNFAKIIEGKYHKGAAA